MKRDAVPRGVDNVLFGIFFFSRNVGERLRVCYRHACVYQACVCVLAFFVSCVFFLTG